MNDKFFRLLQMLRTPREFPPVGLVPVEDSGGGVVRDSMGRPVKALGRLRGEQQMPSAPYAQPDVRGMQLMPNAASAYQGQMGGMPQVAQLAQQQMPEGVPLNDMPPERIYAGLMRNPKAFSPPPRPVPAFADDQMPDLGRIGTDVGWQGAAGPGQDAQWSPEEMADIERNLAEMAWERNNSYLEGLLSLVAGEAEAAQDFTGKKKKRKVRK